MAAKENLQIRKATLKSVFNEIQKSFINEYSELFGSITETDTELSYFGFKVMGVEFMIKPLYLGDTIMFKTFRVFTWKKEDSTRYKDFLEVDIKAEGNNYRVFSVHISEDKGWEELKLEGLGLRYTSKFIHYIDKYLNDE